MPLYLATLCLIFATGLAVGQILMKLAATRIHEDVSQNFVFALLSPPLLAALTLYAVVTALWLFILTKLPLSTAYPFSLLGSAIVPILAYLILRDPLTVKYFAGLFLVLTGLATMYLL